MEVKKVVVAGGGVLGSQIAFQAAYCGFDVTIWLRSEGSIGRTQPKLDKLKTTYLEAIEAMKTAKSPVDPVWCRGIADFDAFDPAACAEKTEAAHKSIKLELDLAKAVEDADIVVESMAEVQEEKTAFFAKLAPLLPEKTILATNSSSLLPSSFTKATGRPAKYLAMHFANSIWKQNIAEVMAQAETAQESFDAIMDFAEKIRMIPLPVNKEKAGYLLNSLLIPFLLSGLDLVANGVSDPESVDKAWKLGTGAPRGPFEIFDVVGLTTAYNIVEKYQKVPGLINPLLKKMMLPYNFKAQKALLKKYIDEGKMGRSSGEGFYKY
ncbi:MAG: 3-hydroxyacyl-CoA dehydrogenase [Oscillospiraceae bacterium]|nr:3-hydroxyacyl-CoA dehydrogenase [Oscillospiraceae bacterium]